MRRLAEQERQLKIALREAEKQKKKEERTKKLLEQREQRRLQQEQLRREKLRQKELMKPREDLLCNNSKVSPHLTNEAGGGYMVHSTHLEETLS